VRCPEAAIPLGAALVSGGTAVEVPVEAGIARATADREAEVVLCYAVRRGFDYLAPDACAALRDTVHGAFDRRAGQWLGSVIVGSFQDELPAMPTWSTRLAAEFVARRGYPLTGKEFAALWYDVPGAGRVRYDYHRTRAELADEAFFAPLREWHEARGMLCGYDQQHPARAGDPVGSTELYADYPKVGSQYGAPGSDHWGDAKFHSGLSHVYGRTRVWLEGFHSSGWGGTLEETFDWLLPWLRAGVTLYDPHAVYYATPGGWWDWAPPSTCWRQPYWPQYPRLADTVARLCHLLSLGTHECGIGLLHPTATVQAGLTPDGPTVTARAAHDEYHRLNGSMSWLHEVPGAIAAAGADHDVLDDASLARGAVADGALCVGGERYHTVLVPACDALTDTTAARLAALARSGGRVWCVGAAPTGALPESGPGWAAFAAALADDRIAVLPTEDVTARLADDREVRCDVPVLVRRAGATRLVLLTAHDGETGTAQPMHGDWVLFDTNRFFDFDRYWDTMRDRGYRFRPLTTGRAATLSVPAGWPPAAELWDPTTGARQRLPVRADGDRHTVRVPFRHGPAAVVVFRHDTGAPHLPAEPDTVLAELPPVWTAELESTLDNRWGDLAEPRRTGTLPVQAWRFDHWTGDGWQPVHATFGPYARQAGPCPDSTMDGAGWRPAVWSLSRGIDRDPLHRAALGPKGYVPEEFLAWPGVEAGEWVALRTTVPIADPPAGLHLAVGAAAHRLIRWNGTDLSPDGDGYLTLTPVVARAGRNELEIRLRADHSGPLRAWWALTDRPDRMRRPEWLTTPATRGPVRITHRFTATVYQDVLQAGTEGAAVIRLNGTEIGRHGGFDPYAQNPAIRVRPYRVAELIRPGANELEIMFDDPQREHAVVVDGIVVSGAGWTWRGAEGTGSVRLRRRQWLDPRLVCLTPRPHPLPAAAWLDPAVADGTVLPLVPDADGDGERTERYRFRLPPGAHRMRLPVAGTPSVTVDGRPVPVAGDAVALPAGGRECELSVRTGRRGGAVFTGPIEYDTGTGTIELGDWAAQGLGSFSGAVHYVQTVRLAAHPAGPVWLDLGEVRGTAEVYVNGARAGELVWSPYRIGVDRWLADGDNTIRITVRNTLGPYLADASPTPGVFAGQRRSGLFGPVRLLAGAAPDPSAAPGGART
jgi:hypothetical protein